MLASNDNAIKRFTYDWLIRFAELHPFTFYDYRDDEVQWRVGAYNPMSSEYAAVSPMFTTLMTRYMPYIFHSDFIKTENGKIKEVDVPSTHKYKIYACTWCHILGPTTPGMISLLEANRVIIYSQLVETRSTALFENTLTVNELKYLLKFGPRDRLFQICGTLSEPFQFAELWPLLQHYKEMRIELQNLIYDDNIATVLRGNKVFPNEVEFCRLNISDKAVLEMVDYFLPKDATLRPTPPLHGSEKEYVPVALKTVPPVRPAAPRIVIPSKPGTSGSVLQVPQIAALPRPQLHTLVPPGLPSPSTTNQSPWRPIIRPYPPATKPPSNVNSKTAHRPQGPPLPRSSPSANPLPQVHEREPTPPPLTPVPSSAHPRPRMPAPSNVTVPSSLPTPLVSTSRRATGAASLATPSAAAPIDAHFETLTAMACFQLLP